MQRLGENDAIEGGRRQHARFGQVANDRCGIIGSEAEDVLPLDLRAAESSGICVLRDLEDAATYVRGVRAEEALDVVAVDGQSAVEAPVRAERGSTCNLAATHPQTASRTPQRTPDPPADALY